MTRELYEPGVSLQQFAGPPPGSYLHAAGPMEGGWRIIEVWQSEAAAFYRSEVFVRTVLSLRFPPSKVTSYARETVRVAGANTRKSA